jgi:hypothetical protein
MFLPRIEETPTTVHAEFNIVDSNSGDKINKKQTNALYETLATYIKQTGQTDVLLAAWCKLGKAPYSLQYYPQFKPLFNLNGAPVKVMRCARQVGKSENLTSSSYLRGRLRTMYNTLMVCPRYEQSRRLSVDKAAPLLRDAVPGVFTDKKCVQRAMERELVNGNKVQYTHCFKGPDAARGYSVNGINYDETQDIVLAYTDIIDQCMSGSQLYYDKLFSGTPKGTTGTLDVKFRATSQGYWATRCPHCNKWSIASDDIDSVSGLYNVELMIGENGPICLHCHRPLGEAPLNGQYVHRYPDRLAYAEGIHVPQVIHYAHWSSKRKWDVLRAFYKGSAELDIDPLPRTTFVNEILGIPMDSEEMLIRPDEIKHVSLDAYLNDLTVALQRRKKYRRIVMSVDWSGYGNENATSYTLLSIIGETDVPADPFDVLYMERLPKSMTPLEQVNVLGERWKSFNPTAFVHDAGGAGFNQEFLIVKANVIPPEKIVPMMYHGGDATASLIEPTDEGMRRGLQVARSRMLIIFFTMLGRGKVLLPEYKSSQSITNDFLALYRDTRSGDTGIERLRILKRSGKSDDASHSLTFGCGYLWYKRGELNKLVQNLTTK